MKLSVLERWEWGGVVVQSERQQRLLPSQLSLTPPHISHNQTVITKLIGKSVRLLKMLKEVKEKEIDNRTYTNIKSQLG